MRALLIDDTKLPQHIPNPESDKVEYFSADNVEVARTLEHAVNLLQNNKYDTLLLDHYIDEETTGLDVINFLDKNPELLPQKIFLITSNAVAGHLMLDRLQQFFKDGKILSYKWIRI